MGQSKGENKIKVVKMCNWFTIDNSGSALQLNLRTIFFRFFVPSILPRPSITYDFIFLS